MNGFMIDLREYSTSRGLFDTTLDRLDELTSSWRSLGEVVLPLGNNPIGKFVANRFVDVSGHYLRTVQDYREKVGDAQEAVRDITRQYALREDRIARSLLGAEAADSANLAGFFSLLRDSGYTPTQLLDQAEAAEWASSDFINWRAFDSAQLHRFAVDDNDPGDDSGRRRRLDAERATTRGTLR